MARAKNTWKLVLTSVVLSILILAAFTAVFINLIVPSYNISREQIYTVLTRALPILIGLLFIEIAVVSSSRSDNSYKDNIDKLAPNAYDSPLYTNPVDDPIAPKSPQGGEYNIQKQESVVKEVIKEVPVEVVKEVVKEVPVEVVREVPVEVEVIKEVPVEVVKEVVKEVPVEVVREVEVPVIKEGELIIRENYTPIEIKVKEEVVVEKPVEVVKEVPIEVIKEVPVEVEVIKEVPVEVVKEVPVEVVREVEVPVIKQGELIIKENYTPIEIKVKEEVVVEKPVEVVKEVPVEVKKEVEKETEDEYLTFREALDEEIREAQSVGYPLTLVAVNGNEEEKLSSVFEAPSFFNDGRTYIILPYTRKKDIARKAKVAEASVIEMDNKSTAESMLKAVI